MSLSYISPASDQEYTPEALLLNLLEWNGQYEESRRARHQVDFMRRRIKLNCKDGPMEYVRQESMSEEWAVTIEETREWAIALVKEMREERKQREIAAERARERQREEERRKKEAEDQGAIDYEERLGYRSSGKGKRKAPLGQCQECKKTVSNFLIRVAFVDVLLHSFT